MAVLAYAEDVDLDDLVDEWLTVPDVAERMGTDTGVVRRLLTDRRVVGVRRGERHILGIPARFLVPADDGRVQPIPTLQGTLVLLADAGLSDEESVRWLFTEDPSLESLGADRPRRPVDALVAGHKTEIRRRAQAEAF